MRGTFGETSPMVESCINDLKSRLIQAGLLKVGSPSGVTDALLFGAIMAVSGFDVASKLAGPGSNAVDVAARLQACNLAKQAVDRFVPGAAPQQQAEPSVGDRARAVPVIQDIIRARVAAEASVWPKAAAGGAALLAIGAGVYFATRDRPTTRRR